MPKFLWRSVIEGFMDGEEEAVRSTVVAQVSISANLARGAKSVSVELVPLAEEPAPVETEGPTLHFQKSETFEAQLGGAP